ncbi:MAG: RagB/SusD family nutrient uptake outer membrane protein [Odoribacter sp.]
MNGKYIKIFIVAASMLTGSCEGGLLDVEPENSVTFVNYFKTEKDLSTAVNAIRLAFRESNVLNAAKPPICRGYIWDNADYTVKMEFNLDVMFANNPYNASIGWGTYYGVIAAANLVLDCVDRSSVSEDRVDFYKGQAYFFRGYEYLYIAQVYGDAPIVRHSRDVGEKAREKAIDVIDFAINDIRKAIALLPTKGDLKDETGTRITKRDVPCRELAYVLLGNALAWKAGVLGHPELFRSAADTLSLAINATDHYSLAGSPELVVTDVLVGNNEQESMFEIQNIWTESSTKSNPFSDVVDFLTWPVIPIEGEGSIKTETDARMKYETVSAMYPQGDLRRKAYFYKLDSMKFEVSDEITGGFAYPYKFRKVLVENTGSDKGRFLNIDQNCILYRLADVILLRAECYARSGQEGLAIEDLNRIRSRAQAKLYPGGVDDGNPLQYVIFKEREKELIWERVRWFDIIRNGYWKTEISERYSELTEKDVSNGALYLPVGGRAFDENPLMVQNRYWLSRY